MEDEAGAKRPRGKLEKPDVTVSLLLPMLRMATPYIPRQGTMVRSEASTGVVDTSETDISKTGAGEVSVCIYVGRHR